MKTLLFTLLISLSVPAFADLLDDSYAIYGISHEDSVRDQEQFERKRDADRKESSYQMDQYYRESRAATDKLHSDYEQGRRDRDQREFDYQENQRLINAIYGQGMLYGGRD